MPPPPSRRQLAPIAWAVLLGLAAAKLALHALSNGPLAWGYMTDELYFLDSVDRLQWGYVDHPPLSIALLRLWRDLAGSSLFAIRVPAALGGAAGLVLTGLLARELGGGRTAQLLAALAAFACPVYLVMTSYYSMNAFDQMLWPLGLLLLVRLANGGAAWLWLALGAVLGVGLLNKVSMLWFAAGVGVGLLLTPERRWLRTPWPWLAALLAAAGGLPYLLWNAAHDWPFLEFSRNAARDKVGAVSLLDFAGQQATALGYGLVPFTALGLAYVLTAPRLRHARGAAWVLLVTAAILAASGGARPHYLAPAFPIAFAGGGVLFERWSARWRWLPAVAVLGTVLLMIGATPLAMPLLSPAATLAWQAGLGLRLPEERERGGALPMHLGLYFHAEAVLAPLERAVARLSPDERARVEILTGSFGETGAVNVLGRARGLPAAIGRHNQYGLWGPGAARGELMLVVIDDRGELAAWFEQCERVEEIDCVLCMEAMDAQSVYLCHRARRPLAELWPAMRVYR